MKYGCAVIAWTCGPAPAELKLALLKPPQPIELVAQPETSVVVITGRLQLCCYCVCGLYTRALL
jgi:hypothetical protein